MFTNSEGGIDMAKTHLNPHQLLDRLEEKYQQKLHFQHYENIADGIRRTLFKTTQHETNRKLMTRTDDLTDVLGYELAE